jgi:hypothetical protein
MSERNPACSVGPGTLTAGSALYSMYMVALVAALGGNLLIRIGAEAGWFAPWMKVVIGILAVVPLGWAAVRFWRVLRGTLDEMLQRIVLEGFAFALVLFIPLAALFVNLRTAGTWSPKLDPPDILLTPAVLVAIGIGIAWRRYR